MGCYGISVIICFHNLMSPFLPQACRGDTASNYISDIYYVGGWVIFQTELQVGTGYQLAGVGT